MNPRESEIKQKIVKSIRMEGGYGRRIEDRFSVGMPDMVLIPRGCPVIWVEAKILLGNILKVDPRQEVELLRLTVAPHSISYMLGWKSGEIYIAPPSSRGMRITECVIKDQKETIGDLFRRVFVYSTSTPEA